MDDEELNRLFGMDPDDGAGDGEGEDKGETEPSESYDDLIAGLIEQPYEAPDEEDEEDGDVIEESEYEEFNEPSEEDGEEPVEDEEPEPQRAVRHRIERPSLPKIDKGPDDFPLTPKRMLIAAAVLVFVTSVVLIATLDAFRIKAFEIEGNYVLSDSDIIEMSGLKYNSHLFFANYTSAAKTLMASSPYVRGCHVSFSIPSTVKIKLDERAKIAYVKTPDGFAALDDQGIVVELVSGRSGSDVTPMISGLDIKRATLGDRIVMGNEADYQRALIVLGSLLAADTNNPQGSYRIFENTREVRVLPSGYIFLTIQLPNTHMLQVKLDSLEKISTQTAWLLYVIDSDVFDLNFPSGALDMTGEEYIYRQFNYKDNSQEGQDTAEGA
ncbi:Cell division septal protein FtsQ [Ruminococcaceae bacterium YRB3002]|nr:Cell division septal protein FtsQ [Ruminococcaceae bacterium YRB3002]